MDITELGRLDLNLLVCLQAMLEEQSVSRAAKRMFVTQSAMSKTLGRMREVFDDPLFVRRGTRMIPTPRAEQLAKQLPGVLRTVRLMMQSPQFDPQTYQGEFKLMVQGHLGVWMLPQLLARLAETAPQVSLSSVSSGDDPLALLADGELDFVLQAERLVYPPDLRIATLGYAPPLLLARKGHPLAGREVSWQDTQSYPHVQLIIPDLDSTKIESPEGSQLVRREMQNTARLRTDHLYTAVRVVLSSDYLFPAPPLFMQPDELAADLIALQVPWLEEMSIKYVMVAHERVGESKPHRFFWGEALAVIEEFRHKYSLPSLADLRAQKNLPY